MEASMEASSFFSNWVCQSVSDLTLLSGGDENRLEPLSRIYWATNVLNVVCTGERCGMCSSGNSLSFSYAQLIPISQWILRRRPSSEISPSNCNSYLPMALQTMFQNGGLWRNRSLAVRVLGAARIWSCSSVMIRSAPPAWAFWQVTGKDTVLKYTLAGTHLRFVHPSAF